VIVRIATEGQFELSDDCASRLNELDNEAVRAVEADDDLGFKDRFRQMLDLVRAEGKPVGDDELQESSIIIPPPDTTLEEARADFNGEGLIPG